MNTPTTELDGFERLLRERLHELADHAPTTVPAVDEVRVAAPRPNRARRTAGIGATIALIAGALGLTTIGFQGAAEPGGADSPEAAVRDFVEALASEDLLGMVDVALPEEVTALRAAMDDAIAQATRLGLLDDAFALDGVAGLDVTVDALALRTETIDSDLVAVSSTDGRLAAAFDATAFPLGRLLRDHGAVTDAGAARDLGADPLTLVTLRRGDRWYVSLGMTVAEAIRRSTGHPVPTGGGPLAAGAPTPEAAAEAFYAALSDLDLAGATTLAAPGEGDVFRRYASLWLPPAEQAVAELRADGLQISLTDLGLRRVTEEDGRITLVPERFVLDGTLPAAWSATIGDGPTRVDEWPTIVNAADGQGAWIVPAGTVPPATVAELDGDPLAPDSPELQAIYGEPFNSTWATPDGTIAPMAEPAPVATEPTPFRIERRDGCTTATGSPISEMIAFAPGAEVSADGTARSCRDGDLAGLASAFLLVRGSGTVLHLPPITVVEDGGQWFVSPIGTIAAQIIDPFRSLPDDANVIDIPFVSLALVGTDRADLDRTLRHAVDVPPECAPIVEPDGDGGLRTIADPVVADVEACTEVMWNSGWTEYSVEIGSETVPAPVEAPPASARGDETSGDEAPGTQASAVTTATAPPADSQP